VTAGRRPLVPVATGGIAAVKEIADQNLSPRLFDLTPISGARPRPFIKWAGGKTRLTGPSALAGALGAHSEILGCRGHSAARPSHAVPAGGLAAWAGTNVLACARNVVEARQAPCALAGAR